MGLKEQSIKLFNKFGYNYKKKILDLYYSKMAHEFFKELEDDLPSMYRIAIPTYNRPKIFKEKTLALLAKSNISMNDIDVFVENEEQLKLYCDELLEDYPNLQYIITNTKGICEKRNYVRYYYTMENYQKYVFNMDDDLEIIMDKDDNEFTDFHNFITSGFTECERVGATMFGISPLHNPFFLRNNISYRLNYIIGAFFGVIHKEEGELPYMTELEHYEDFDFCLYHYFKDKKLVRYNHLGLKTKYFEPTGGITYQMGGLQARHDYMNSHSQYMVDKWGEDAVKITKNKWGTGLKLNHNHRFK